MKQFWAKLTSSQFRKNLRIKETTSNEQEFFNLEWWTENKHSYPQDLQDLTDQFFEWNDLKFTSKYWLHLMFKNYKMLKDAGFDNFGTTVSRNYFTWTDYNQAQIGNLAVETIDSNLTFPIFKKHLGFNHEESYKHNTIIVLLYEALKQLPFARDALNRISDKGFLLGNTPFIEHDGLVLTLDKLSSISEIIVLENILSKDSPSILEIGGGSGRNSDLILQLYPSIKLIYCDIPPASYIALNRFKLVFPEKNIIVVKSNKDFDQLLSNPYSWDILMISPAMLDNIPEKYIELFIAIDCLHEFSNENRAKLAGVIQETAHFFYTKNWTDTIIPFDEIPLSSNHLSGYFFPERWEILRFQKSIFPGNFTEILFRVN